MEMPPMPPMPPHDHRFWETEANYRREQAQRGGVVSDMLVSLIELFKLALKVLWLPGKLAFFCWRKLASRNVTR